MSALTLQSSSDPAMTMTSREIADLTGKEHKNVLADARKMLADLGKAAADFSATAQIAGPNNSTREIEVLNLPKRETLILVSGYSVELRARIIDRWQELEAKAAPAPVDLSNPASLRTLLLGYVDTVIALQAEVAEMTPKAEFADAVADASNCQTVEETGKVFGWGKIKMFRFLRDDGMLMPNNLPYQAHLEAGRFRVIEKTWTGDDGVVRVYPQTLVTGKGLAFIQKRVAIHREVEHAT